MPILEKQGLAEEETLLLFSAHGVPRSFICTGDLYQAECELSYRNTRRIPSRTRPPLLPVEIRPWGEWIRPYTDETCEAVLNWSEGRKQVVVVPITFTSDHIETLFEVEELYLPIPERTDSQPIAAQPSTSNPIGSKDSPKSPGKKTGPERRCSSGILCSPGAARLDFFRSFRHVPYESTGEKCASFLQLSSSLLPCSPHRRTGIPKIPWLNSWKGTALCEEQIDQRKAAPQKGASFSLLEDPFAIVVGCSDSRVPPEIIFDQGLGDLFIVRVAGNVIGPIEMDSIEFSADKLKTPLILVLGHKGCGAVEALTDDPDEPDLVNIAPQIRRPFSNPRSSR